MAEYSIRHEQAPVHMSIEFKSRSEAANLYEELRTWSPSSGWSEGAEEFFGALRMAGEASGE